MAVRLLSTRELSDALGVSESSLKRWVDAGRIAASRTHGGHRRIALAEAMRFIRETGAQIVRPELLDLPEVAAAREGRHQVLLDYLLDGDLPRARGWLTARFLEGQTVAALGDGPIREAMHALGELWHRDDAGVFIEHRATDACLHALAQLRTHLPREAADAPVAVGGAPEGDPYLIPTQLAAMVAAEAGLRAINLGADSPPSAFRHAVAKHRPRLVWVSVTAPLSPARARGLVRGLEALPAATSIIVGGQEAAKLRLPARVARATTMRELGDLARSVATGGRARTSSTT